jgi:3-oxoacyl-[acyl-carrier-protein] synthase II
MSADLEEPSRAIRLALEDAEVQPEELAYGNLHGTGTELNDRVETAVVKRALGPEVAAKVPMSSTKSLIGHPQGACGAAGIAATLLALGAGFLPPTLNLEVPDPACDLDYIPDEARPAPENAIWLWNSMGFGSKNSVIILRAGEG